MSAPARHIAVLGRGLAGWGGGVDLLRLILNGLCAVSEPGRTVTLLLRGESWARTARRRASAALRALAGRTARRSTVARSDLHEVFADYAGNDAGNHAGANAGSVQIRFYTGGTRALARVLRAIDAGVVLPALDALGTHFPVPWIGYIYDFQHRYLPELFSERERERRDAAFEAMLAQARSIIVTSRAVADDVARFYPHSHARVVALPFSAALRPQLLLREPAQVRAQWGVPERYFILCNQFWVHKDHRTAFLAFAQLLRSTADDTLVLVCTGSLEDTRAPGHADRLRTLLSSLGIAPRVLLLGYLPKPEQIALMRGAIALIQPTLFEGGPGGGSTYDAVALGLPVILSDIPVNREVEGQEEAQLEGEVEGQGISYFAAGDPEALAARMAQALRQDRPSLSPLQLEQSAARRLARLGRTLEQAISEAVRDAR